MATAVSALALAACGAATALPVDEPHDGAVSDAATADESDFFDDDGGIFFPDSSLPDSSSFDAQFERPPPVYGAPPRRPK